MSKNYNLTQADYNAATKGPPRMPTLQSSFGTDPKTLISAIKEILEVREGQRGSILDKGLTWRDLFDQGVIALNIDGKAIINKPGGGIVPAPANGGAIDQTPPPAPTGLQAVGALASIIVTWDKPVYGAHSHTEVWASGTDDIGTAQLIGTSPSQIYVDVVGTGTVRYYWIKWVSKFPVTGPFNKTAGTRGETGYDAQYLIDVLSANPPPGGTYNPLLYVQSDPNLVVDGVPIPVGTYMTAAYIANASIGRLQVQLAAIDDARIASLHAAKIVAGDIDADRMKANIVQAVQGQFVSLSAITSWLGTVTIGQYGYLRTDGVSDFMVGVGAYMGWHTDQYKFRVGDPSGQHIRWENGQLYITGNLSSTGSGTFRGTFIAGNANSLYPGGGENGLYAGEDGFFVGTGRNPLTEIPNDAAYMRLDRAARQVDVLAQDINLICGHPTRKWAIYSDGDAYFADLTVNSITVTGGGSAPANNYSVSYSITGSFAGATRVQFSVAQASFVHLWMGVTAGSIETVAANVSSQAHDYTQVVSTGALPGKGPVFARVYQNGHEDGSAPAQDTSFSFGFLPAGTYYLNLAAGNNGTAGGDVAARILLVPLQ